MSALSIAAFFPFRRIKITAQQVSTEATEAHIQTEPDMRFHPICHGYRSRTWAAKALDNWCAIARSLNHPSVTSFAKTLDRYRYGILNHCDYPIHTGKIKGVNNRIKVIKRKAYGFHDIRYFTLKIYQAFSN